MAKWYRYATPEEFEKDGSKMVEVEDATLEYEAIFAILFIAFILGAYGFANSDLETFLIAVGLAAFAVFKGYGSPERLTGARHK